jgi:hypothetical protein
MHSISDYINRFGHVSPGEILYRVKRVLIEKRMERKLSPDNTGLCFPDMDLSSVTALELPGTIKTDTQDTLPQAHRQEDFSAFEDEFSRIFFSRIRPGPTAPDIRSAWERARLQTELAQILQMAEYPQGKGKADRSAPSKVVNWIKKNPFLFGVHYISPMECGLRVPVFFFALKALNPVSRAEDIRTLLSAVYSHSWWISQNMALYSSRGNHTVCESMGLVFGGAVFRHTTEGKKWLKTGCRILEEELHRQILPDGGPVEQSLNYHRFVLDLYWLALDFLRANNLYGCHGWKNHLKKGEVFIRALSYDGRHFPSIGDSDDGYALAQCLVPRYRPRAVEQRPASQEVKAKTFPDSGYTVVRSHTLFMTFDHGPLGMPPLYNHGHADALSITLYISGLPFLIDPGTFQYNGDPRRRTYFKGTRAHNTVCIDKKDQARQVSGFIWNTPFSIVNFQLNQTGKQIRIQAGHTGYQRLTSPVTHQRQIQVNKDGSTIIFDSFTGNGCHEFELNFHLHPDVTLVRKKDYLWLRNREQSVYIVDPKETFTVFRGSKNPYTGWYSAAYGHIQPSITLRARKEGKPEKIQFSTVLIPGQIPF